MPKIMPVRPSDGQITEVEAAGEFAHGSLSHSPVSVLTSRRSDPEPMPQELVTPPDIGSLERGISLPVGTMGTVGLEILAGVVLVAGWHVAFVRYNRRRANDIVLWIRTAFSGHAQILGVHWISSSRFHVRLRLVPNVFQHAQVVVQLLPREFFFNYLLSKFRKQQELATFEADLDSAPCFNLEVHNRRWCGRSRRGTRLDPNNSYVESLGPFVLTTRYDWQREITGMVDALVASRDSDFLTVRFRKDSPHLSATVALDRLAPQHSGGNQVFHILRELADCAGATQL